jgi:biopolymer transport protein ExbD
MATATHDTDEMITSINVTPLVDITLVLLIILMITASYVASKAIPLDLPKGATAETQVCARRYVRRAPRIPRRGR